MKCDNAHCNMLPCSWCMATTKKETYCFYSGLLRGKIRVLISAKREALPSLAIVLKAWEKCFKATRTEIGCSLAPYNAEIFDSNFN